ncbi:hypothetical protein V500_00587 [Pseudogymnoascus sp. VKM F-4518 (FW-2643)]|nr:hypothetical protein V500_00587 [Pseudogymnoascus sp. VKM F-4518 (FW-2643)]
MSIEQRPMNDGSSPLNSTIEENSSTSPQGGGDKRKRHSAKKQSCERCKARKVKCDQVEPTCGWCSRNKRVCVYYERNKPGPRSKQVSEQKKTIDRLEAMLLVLGRRFEDHISDHHKIDHARISPSVGSQPTPIMLGSRFPHIDPFEQFQQPSDSRSILSMEWLENPASAVHPTSSTSSPRNGWTSEMPDPDLPPYEMLYSLVDLYFKHVNTWCPILDRNTTFDAFFQRIPPNEPDRILLHAIVVTCLRFCNEPHLTPETRQQYSSVSKQKVQLYGLENANVRALQALVVISLDVLGTSNGPEGWNLLAIIARNITQLGLGVEKNFGLAPSTDPLSGTIRAFTLPQPKSWIEDEERRRLFWMVYVLDRYATICTAFDFLLDEKQADRCLPCRYDLFSENQPVETRWFRDADRTQTGINKPENLGSFSYHCEVLRILSRIHKFLNTPVDIESPAEVERWQTTYWKLDGELDSWSFNLPDEYGKISQLCHSDPNSKIANWIILHAAYVTTVIRLHSAAAYPSVHSHIFKPSFVAMQRCLAAVESLKEISVDVINTGMLDLLGPVFALSVWVSARLLIVHASIAEHELDPNVVFFVSILDQMGQYWPVAQKYAEILSRLLSQHLPVDQTGPEAVSSTMRTFAGMRSRAYQLNLLMVQQRRSVLEPISSITPAPNELEYLDIFDFFIYPRLNLGKSRNIQELMVISENVQPINRSLFTHYAIPDPENDWSFRKMAHR